MSSTSGFKKLGRDCPICQGNYHRHDCRESLSTGFIFCRDTTATPGGQWRYIKDDANGCPVWAWGEGESGDRPLRVTFIPPKKQVPTLPPAARDQAYRALIAQAGLQPEHRAGIAQRPHVTEAELEQLAPYLFTWQGGAAAPAAAGLPGVVEGQLWPRVQNWAIAIPNHEGQIVGAQIKNPKGGYFWASGANAGGAAPHVEGELPLGVYGTHAHSGYLELAEGYLKPALAQARHGGLWVGMAGGQWAKAPQQMRDVIKARSIIAVILNADGGAIANDLVMRSYRELVALLKEWGIGLRVRWWGQATKADGDVDEISAEQLSQAKYLKWEEFEAIAAPAATPAPVAEIDTYRQKMAAQAAQESAQWLVDMAKLAGAPAGADRAAIAAAFDKQHKLSGPVEVGTFPELALPMQGQRVLTLLDGQKMTRKTSNALRSVVAQSLAQGIGGVIYVPTRVLGRALVAELRRGLPDKFKDCLLTVDHWQALEDTEEGDKRPKLCWIVGCPESAYKLAELDPAIVCFDEANESIPRVQSGQLGLYPAQSRAAIKGHLVKASMVVLAQEGLYRPTVAAVQRWGNFDPSQVEVIRRRRVATDMAINLYLEDGAIAASERWDGLQKAKPKLQPNPAFYTWFDACATAHKDGPVILPSGSEGKGRIMDRVLKAALPSTKSQVLDGKHTPGIVRRQFADDPQAFAQERGLGRLSYSPTFDSGVSIEGQHFGSQFEYIRAFETASSASQRGERYRDAIKGDRLKARNVYISTRGLPAQPPVEVFTADYWQELLHKPTQTDAIALAKQMGLNEMAERLSGDPGDDWAELPEFMAIAARETFFKVELLCQEWAANGWPINRIEPRMDTCETWSKQFYDVRQRLIEKQARGLAMATGKQSEEITGAIAATKAKKWELGEILGQDFAPLRDPEWVESWVVASGDRSLYQLQVRALVKLAHEAPTMWAELARQFALSTLAYGQGIALPPLPCSSRVFEQAKLLKDAPGVYPAIAGHLGQWTNQDMTTRDSAQWARANAKALARLSQHNQRIHGLQFTAKTPDIKCFHKLLGMVGLDGHCTGRQSDGARLWVYRVQVASDLESAIARAEKRDRPQEVRRQRYRLEHDAKVFATLEAVLTGQIQSGAKDWAEVADQLIPPPSTTSVVKESITEVLDGPQLSPGILVRKRDVSGWRGPIVEVQPGGMALIHWFGDPAPTLTPLSALEVAA